MRTLLPRAAKRRHWAAPTSLRRVAIPELSCRTAPTHDGPRGGDTAGVKYAAPRTSIVLAAVAALLAACAAPAPGASPASAPANRPVTGAPGRAASQVVAGPQCGPQPYPAKALQDFEHGPVIVRVQVGADGRVSGGAIEQPAHSPYLNAAALDAVRYCRFPVAPGMPHDARLLVSYDFSGEDEYLPRGFVTIGLLPAGSR